MKKLLRLFLGIALILTAGCAPDAVTTSEPDPDALLVGAQSANSALAQLGVYGTTEVGGTNLYYRYLVYLNSNGVFDASVIPGAPVDYNTAFERVAYIDAVNGSDGTNGTGSATRPYQTLTNALATATNDTTFIFGPGTYAGGTITDSNITELTLSGLGPNVTVTDLFFDNTQDVNIVVYNADVGTIWQKRNRDLTIDTKGYSTVTTITRTYTTSSNSVLTIAQDAGSIVPTVVTNVVYTRNYLADLVDYSPNNPSNWPMLSIPDNVEDALDTMIDLYDDFVASNVVPAVTNILTLYGYSNHQLLWTNGTTVLLDWGQTTPILQVWGDVIPGTNDTYNLGNSNFWFASAWLGTNSLHLGGTALSRDANTNLVWNGFAIATVTNLNDYVHTNDVTYTTTVALASAAFGWGDHSTNGYGLASAIATVSGRVDTVEGFTNYSYTAFTWGDHATNGYGLASAIATVSGRVDTVEGFTNYAYTAFLWGDHSTNSYAVTTAYNKFTVTNEFDAIIYADAGIVMGGTLQMESNVIGEVTTITDPAQVWSIKIDERTLYSSGFAPMLTWEGEITNLVTTTISGSNATTGVSLTTAGIIDSGDQRKATLYFSSAEVQGLTTNYTTITNWTSSTNVTGGFVADAAAGTITIPPTCAATVVVSFNVGTTLGNNEVGEFCLFVDEVEYIPMESKMSAAATAKFQNSGSYGTYKCSGGEVLTIRGKGVGGSIDNAPEKCHFVVHQLN